MKKSKGKKTVWGLKERKKDQLSKQKQREDLFGLNDQGPFANQYGCLENSCLLSEPVKTPKHTDKILSKYCK